MLIPAPVPDGPGPHWPTATLVLVLMCALGFGWTMALQRESRPAVDAAVERLEVAVAASPQGRLSPVELDGLPDRWRLELSGVTDAAGPGDSAMSSAVIELRQRVHEMPAWRFGWVPSTPTSYGWLSYIFVHTQWFHLLVNILLLWLLGATLERRCSSRLMVLCFLIAGVAGACVHGWLFSTSSVPLVGASAAVAGVLGGLLVGAPSRHLAFALVVGRRSSQSSRDLMIPLGAILLTWCGLEWIAFLEANTAPSALFAHLSGGLTGAVIALVWRRSRVREPHGP